MVSQADAIVVLGCMVRPGARPSPALARRTDLALYAYQQGVSQHIVASGGRRWHGHSEAETIASRLQAAGVPKQHVELELMSQTTVQNARYCAQVLPPESRVMLATCRWHLARASRAFRRVGLNVIEPPASWDSTPPPGSLRRVREHLAGWLDGITMSVAR